MASARCRSSSMTRTRISTAPFGKIYAIDRISVENYLSTDCRTRKSTSDALRTNAVSSTLTNMRSRSVLRTVPGAGAVGHDAAPAAETLPADSSHQATLADIYFSRWRTDVDFRSGTAIGTVVGGDAITFGTPVGRLTYPDPHSGTTGTYEFATWTSAEVAPGFGAKEIISSWIATTPGGCWLQIELRGTTPAGTFTKWYVV